MSDKRESADLFITLIYSRDELSSIIREIVEYAISIVRESYRLKIVYREIIDSKQDFPTLLINELEPIILDEIPSLENIVKLLLVDLKMSNDKVSEHSDTSCRALTTYL